MTVSNLRASCSSILTISLLLTISIIQGAEPGPTSPRPAWTTSRVKGSPESPAPYRIAAAFPKVRFTNPTSIEEIPRLNRLLITEMSGKIYSLLKRPGVEKADLVADLVELLPNELAGQTVSLFDAELHPDFLENRYMFVCYVHPGEGGHTRVSRFTLTADLMPRVVRASEQVVITWPSGGHNAGCLEFGKDGMLYISTGDGSGPNPPDGLTTGQDVSDLLGAILRIDVDKTSGDQAYAIPNDNPFVDLDGARPEIWAYGLRNPWKFGIDAQTGATFAADNGWESWEMVHRIFRGGNCGWPVMEGRAVLRREVKVGPTPIVPPVKDHSHTEANSVIAGPVYRGSKLPDLDGSFIYGDYITGTIWSVRGEEGDTYSHATLVDTDQRIVAFAEGSKGELFVLDYDLTGQIYELLPSDLQDTSAEFPRRLSETGLFASLESLHPAPGVVPYDVQVDRWLDGARAQRWVAIPGKGKIKLAPNAKESGVFPEGTVLVKHLSLPPGANSQPLRLETQVLHYENETWRPYSYLWDEHGKDAHLVSSIGANRALRILDAAAENGFTERTWHVSAINECKLCHNAGSQFVLGFVPNQLNISTTNQLLGLVSQEVLAGVNAIPDDDPARLVDPHDESQSLDDRARSYLHANCAACHHPGGNAIVSFYLRRELPFDKLKTNKGTGIGTFGMRNAKIIVPGDPYRSVLMYRMSKLGYARMPYIGSQVVDSDGVALIAKWIRSLSSDTTEESSPPVVANSVEAKSLGILVNREGGVILRTSALEHLFESTEGSLALVERVHGGDLSPPDVYSAVAIGGQVGNTNIRGLFETFVPESKRRQRLGPNIDPQTILGLKGDAARGKLIFFSDGARCRACHDATDKDKSLGTTLVEINKKYPRRSEMLQHVLKPSLKIDEPLAAYAVFTTDGRAITGLLAETTDEAIVIRTAERKTIRVARKNIDEMQKSPKSLMPDQILSDLTAQEAADLLAYIRSLGAGETR
jgi:putative heme-binding domain-containing protein